MEQFEKIVLKTPPEGMHYAITEGENGELIIRLVSKASAELQPVEQQREEPFFTKITAEDREKVKKWVARQNGKTDREKAFLKIVKEAVRNVNYDYCIANLEPSVEKGKIYYAENHDVGVKFSCNQWGQMARDYKPERGSRLCNLHELFIWYALRIVNKLWTLDYVANDSSSAGNYWNAPESSKAMDKTGAKECGGYRDGQGNTYKIVTREGGYALVGGYYYLDGDLYPVADVFYYDFPNSILDHGSGILVLTRLATCY